MFLFLISFLLIFISSYLLSGVLNPKKASIGVIYLFLIAFAQIILTFEILSLFSAINQFWVMGVNILVLLISVYLWNRVKRPVWTLQFANEKKRIFNALRLDKSLKILFFGYCAFILVSVFLCMIMPITNEDALSYHVVRSLFWIFQGNLNHFVVADVRNLGLPINSEILYSWLLLFVRKDLFLGFFAFTGYFIAMLSVYSILRLLGYCVRKRLWVIFILTSIPSVLVQVSATETDIILAGLITSSIFLFWYALKNNEKIPVIMASLAYAIAIGTKTTAIVMIPAVGLLFSFLCFKYKNYKYLILFLISGLINFLLFSSYNYILNYLQFSNFMGASNYIAVNKNDYGIRGAASNFIKYIYMFVDFTGFKWSLYLNPYLKASENSLFTFLHIGNIPDYCFSPNSIRITLIENTMGVGIIGFLVYIPCVILSFFKYKLMSKKSLLLAVFGGLFLINTIIISCLLSYSIFDVRYFVAFLVLSSPVLVYSYGIKFKPLKYLIIFFSLYSLALISTNLYLRPFFGSIQILNNTHSITYLRKILTCKNLPYCTVQDQIHKEFSPNNKILVFDNTAENIYLLKMLQFEGYTVDFAQMSDASNINFNKYNLLILKDNKQISSVLNNYKNNKSKSKSNNVGQTGKKIPGVYCSYAQPVKDFPVYYFLKCKMSDNFLSERHFDVSSVVVNVDNDTNEVKHYYLIYENKNNPPQNKKQ